MNDTAAVTTLANHPPANHPLAPRMCAIAFLAYNLTIGSLFGTYGILMGPIEAKLGLTRDVSSLGIPLILVGIALLAPVVGVLAGKFSIRLLMMVGTLLLVGGFLALAVASNVAIFLGAYGLLLGPGYCFLATMLPPTLVTRWYRVDRGRALGIVNMPILSAMISPLVAYVLTRHGLNVTYLMLAGLLVLFLPVLLFVVDYPPDFAESNTAVDAAPVPVPASGLRISELLGSRAFWTLSLAYASIMIGQTVMAAHIVPLAIGWGITATSAAGLLTASSFGGMAGSVVFGWLTDRIGGALTMVVLCVNSAILWAVLLLHPGLVVLMVLVALLGLHGAGVGAVASMAISQRFGQASFGRAFGLSNLIILPFLVSGVPIAGHLYVRTGSYTLAIITVIGVFVFGALSASMSRSGKTIQPIANTV
jgi:MFS family permease